MGQSVRGTGDFATQFREVLDKLVQNTYPQLDYITAPLDPKQAASQITSWAKLGKPASTVGFNDLALDSVIRYLEQQQGLFTRVSMKKLREMFSRPPYGWADGDIAGLVAVLLGMQRIRLSYNMEPLTADNPQLADRLLRVVDQPKIVVDLIVAMPTSERTRVAQILREHFGYAADLEDSYEGVAKTIHDQLEARLLNPLSDVKAVQKAENPTYPYPGGSTIARLTVDLAAIPHGRGGKDLVQAFMDNRALWPDALDRMEKLTGFYLKTPRARFDDAVAVLTGIAQDIGLATQYATVQSLHQRIKTILQEDEPYDDIPSLPKLCRDLAKALDEAVSEEKERHAKEIDRVLAEVTRIRSEHASVPENVEGIIGAVTDTLKAYREATSLSLVLATLSLVRQRLEDVHRAMRAIEGDSPDGPRLVSLGQVLRRTARGTPRRISSPSELVAYLEEVQAQCLEILQSEGIIVIDATED